MKFGTLLKKASISQAPENFTDRLMAQIEYLPKHKLSNKGELLNNNQKWILSIITFILLIGTFLTVIFFPQESSVVPAALQKVSFNNLNQTINSINSSLDPVFISSICSLIILSFLLFDHLLRKGLKRKVN
jgi:hypothetical protein